MCIHMLIPQTHRDKNHACTSIYIIAWMQLILLAIVRLVVLYVSPWSLRVWVYVCNHQCVCWLIQGLYSLFPGAFVRFKFCSRSLSCTRTYTCKHTNILHVQNCQVFKSVYIFAYLHTLHVLTLWICQYYIFFYS